jgi:hypothetical protein
MVNGWRALRDTQGSKSPRPESIFFRSIIRHGCLRVHYVHNIVERRTISIFHLMPIWKILWKIWNTSTSGPPPVHGATTRLVVDGYKRHIPPYPIISIFYIIYMSADPPPPMPRGALPHAACRMPGAMLHAVRVAFCPLARDTFFYLRLRRRPNIPCAGFQPSPIFYVPCWGNAVYRNMDYVLCTAPRLSLGSRNSAATPPDSVRSPAPRAAIPHHFMLGALGDILYETPYRPSLSRGEGGRGVGGIQ